MEILEQYERELQHFVDKLKEDNNIICVILAGSLYNKSMNKDSDINLIVIVADDKMQDISYTCMEEEVIFNIDVFSRTQFIQNISVQRGDMYRYSYLAKNKVIYSKDETLNSYIEEIRTIRKEFYDFNIFNQFCDILYHISVINKWLEKEDSTRYVQFQFSKIAEKLAQIEYCLNTTPLVSEAVEYSEQWNPELFKYYYTDLFREPWDREHCVKAVNKLYQYFDEHLNVIAKPILKMYRMLDKNVITLREISKYYCVYPPFIYLGCKYLSDKEIISMVSVPENISKRGKIEVENVAFLYIQ